MTPTQVGIKLENSLEHVACAREGSTSSERGICRVEQLHQTNNVGHTNLGPNFSEYTAHNFG